MSAETPNSGDASKAVPGDLAPETTPASETATGTDSAVSASEQAAHPVAPPLPGLPTVPAPTTADAAVAEAIAEPVRIEPDVSAPVVAAATPVAPKAAEAPVPTADPAPPVSDAGDSGAADVERALADAVAGSRANLPAAVEAEPAVAPVVVAPVVAEPVVVVAVSAESAVAEPAAAEPVAAEPVAVALSVAEPVLPPAPTVVATPVYAEPIAPIVYAQPVEEPRAAGNRLAGILIGLVSTIIFAAAFWGLRFVYGFSFNDEFSGGIADSTVLLGDAGFWGAVIGFFVGTVIVALLVNRAGWWAHLLFGLVIALFAYAGAIGGDLFANRNEIYTDEVGQAILDRLIAPMSLIAFILGREIPIWFGLWTSALGRRAKARTAQAREEYEREVHG